MAVRIRDILRDNPSPTEQGVFWSDNEIRLALNASQDAVVNYSLSIQLTHPLIGLIRTAVYNAPTQAIIDNAYGFQGLPNNYMHYASAYVIDTPDEDLSTNRSPAKIYIGADAETYRNSIHVGVSILQNGVKAVNMLNPNAAFILDYYCYPSYIGLTSLGDASRLDFTITDFSPEYYDIILRHAAVLLGTKETLNQRDFKKRQEEHLSLSLKPRGLTHLVKDLDDNMPRRGR